MVPMRDGKAASRSTSTFRRAKGKWPAVFEQRYAGGHRPPGFAQGGGEVCRRRPFVIGLVNLPRPRMKARASGAVTGGTAMGRELREMAMTCANGFATQARGVRARSAPTAARRRGLCTETIWPVSRKPPASGSRNI